MSERPRCPVCKKALPKRTTSAHLKAGETYRGNLQVVSRRHWHGGTTIGLWDGESWGPAYCYPFHSNDCAITFATSLWQDLTQGRCTITYKPRTKAAR